ncbi:hypothetical protein ACFOEQ_26950 [Chryseobacterium arachidis]|uniref:hypothetical protein n=1 Tax=Chryseobacterium arachidis TaxID=1416778 RepID=UPI00361A8CB5
MSSNRSGQSAEFDWGGTGWIIEPMTGNLLESTTPERKFVTHSIDLKKTAQAKKEYPLNVNDFMAEMTKSTEVTVNAILPGPTKSRGIERFHK